ncbi:MAG: TIM barrel protein [Gemmatimonadetes bacterium]|nr:TIM barrel protein [Gemmatimonadota bacterium]
MAHGGKNRREWLRDAGAVAAGIVAAGALPGAVASGQRLGNGDATPPSPARDPESRGAVTEGARADRIRQSASRWCYSRIPLPDLCKAGKEMGLSGIDLLQEADWNVVIDHGLTVTMGYAADRRDFLSNGFTNRASHPMLIKELERAIPIAAKKGVPNIIAMFGNRAGRTDVEAISAAVDGLRVIAPLAEKEGVTICVELLNSRVDHLGYHGDSTQFGVDVMKGVASSRVKLLYDIYHMQIMEGDVIRTIRRNKEWIGHYHTGGVPGRHELDDTQELNWPAIVTAIADSGFTGYVAHEFVPTRDPLTSLREAVRLCDI